MNLYLLVEGRRTEPRLYPAWLGWLMPSLRQVSMLSDVDDNTYVIVSGYGYPSYHKRIHQTLADIADAPGLIDRYIVCVDAEELTLEERRAMVWDEVKRADVETSVRARNPNLKIDVVVQDCCIETWLLGNSKFMRRNPNSAQLAQWKKFYDVSIFDPEKMPMHSGYITRASFHEVYLRAMISERGDCSYSKRNPGVTLDRAYLDALIERWEKTAHISSFGHLLNLIKELT
jgi:hypothetical protein